MAKVLNAIIWLAVFVIASISGVSAQTQANEEVIKIDTTLVSVPVIVSDRQGHYISGLQTKDFKIFQDGIEQKIDFFAASEEPLNVAVLIDTSRSTSEVLDDIKDAAKSFVKLLNTNDKAMIVTFDYEPHVLSKLTSSKNDLNRAIESAEIGGQYGTTLNDAVNEVVEKIFKEIKGRKAIILLTDGKDFGSATESDDLLYSLQESDTLIYPIFYKTGGLGFGRRNRFGNRFPFPQRRNGRLNEVAAEFLKKMADATAGRFYSNEIIDLTKTLAIITDELRYQYRLGFYPLSDEKAGTSHEIKIKVARPEVVVRARQAYRVTDKKSSK